MQIKIRGGTAKRDEPTLCLTCRHATIVRGTSHGDQIIECGRLMSDNCRIDFPVTFCTDYSDRRLPSLREMEEMAWVLRTDPGRKRVGFVRAHELKPHDRYVLADEDS